MTSDDHGRTRQAAESVVRGEARTVVAAVDESSHADAVFEFVCNNFNRADTKVVFVYVLKTHDAHLRSYAAEASEAQSKKYLADGWVDRAKSLKMAMQCEGYVLTGDAREELLLFCRCLRPDALVLGSHGRGALKRALLGSVSDFLVHQCPCPVVVVRRPKGEEGTGGGVYNAFFEAMANSFRRKQGAQAEGQGGEEAKEASPAAAEGGATGAAVEGA